MEKCPAEFPTIPTWHVNGLDIMTLQHHWRKLISDCFLSLLLQSGADSFVNKVGLAGYRPLNLA